MLFSSSVSTALDYKLIKLPALILLMPVNYAILAKPPACHPQAQLVAWFSQLYGGQHATRCYLTHFRPDLLNLLLLDPSGSKIFRFRKFDLVGELMHACM